MNYLITVFTKYGIKEAALFSGSSITIGTGFGDTIRMPGKLDDSHIKLTHTKTGLYMSSKADVMTAEGTTTSCMLALESTVQITSGISFAVFEARVGDEPPVLIAGQNEVSIGRSKKNDICLPGGLVSSKHAVLINTDGNWTIIDAGSKNGTYVSGKRVDRMQLTDHSSIFISGWKLLYKSERLHFENQPGSPVCAKKFDIQDAEASALSPIKHIKIFNV